MVPIEVVVPMAARSDSPGVLATSGFLLFILISLPSLNLFLPVSIYEYLRIT